MCYTILLRERAMRRILTVLAGSTLLSTAAIAEDVKLGIIFGFTGPIESLTQPMAAAAELAMKEATESGIFLGGSTVSSVR